MRAFKRKKWFIFTAAVTLLIGIATGCSTMVEGNAVKVAAVSTKTSGLVLPGPQIWVVADPSVANDILSGQCRRYLVNGIKQLGLKEAPAPDQADAILVYSYKEEKPRRFKTTLNLSATQAKTNKIFWQGEAFCTSGKANLPEYLPGLTAATILFFNRNENSKVALKNYPNMVRAVIGSRQK